MKRKLARGFALLIECYQFYARPIVRLNDWLDSGEPVAMIVSILFMAVLSCSLAFFAFQFPLLVRLLALAIDVTVTALFMLQTVRNWRSERREQREREE